METVSNSALRPQYWEKKLFVDVMRGLYFQENGMMGNDENNIIQTKSELEKTQGNKITVGLTTRLTGNGVDGDDEAEGNEEAINSYSDEISINQKRFPAKTKGKFDEQQNMYNMRTDIKDKLKIRMTEFIERQFFLKLGSVANTSLTDVNGTTVGTGATWSNTPDIVTNAITAAGTGERYVCAAAGGAAAFTSADTITPALITKAKTRAMLADPKVVPLRIKGKPYYILFVHPWQAVDLKNHASYNQAMLYAQNRGAENPLFTGALGVWDGVIVHEHEFVPYLNTASAGFNFGAAASGTNYGAGGYTKFARAILVGKQAGVFAKCKNPNGWAEETSDFGNKIGFCVSLIGGIQKIQFNSEDYGVVTLDTAVTEQ